MSNCFQVALNDYPDSAPEPASEARREEIDA